MQAALLACVLEVVVMAHAPGWEEGEVIGKDIAFPSPSLQLIGMAGMLDLWEACNWAYILLEPEMWGCIGHSEAAEGLKVWEVPYSAGLCDICRWGYSAGFPA